MLVNEINTMPGFTPSLDVPADVWQHAGLSYPELIDELHPLALERRARPALTHPTSGGREVNFVATRRE